MESCCLALASQGNGDFERPVTHSSLQKGHHLPKTASCENDEGQEINDENENQSIDQNEAQETESPTEDFNHSNDIEPKKSKDGKQSCYCSALPWHKKLMSFFGSYVGLFIIFALYSAGGAYYFHKRESAIENESYEQMMTEHDNLIESTEYLSEFLSDILYDKRSYNNCTTLVNDTCFQKDIQNYTKACNRQPIDCTNSEFCRCVKTFMKIFENDVSL